MNKVLIFMSFQVSIVSDNSFGLDLFLSAFIYSISALNRDSAKMKCMAVCYIHIVCFYFFQYCVKKKMKNVRDFYIAT